AVPPEFPLAGRAEPRSGMQTRRPAFHRATAADHDPCGRNPTAALSAGRRCICSRSIPLGARLFADSLLRLEERMLALGARDDAASTSTSMTATSTSGWVF